MQRGDVTSGGPEDAGFEERGGGQGGTENGKRKDSAANAGPSRERFICPG